MTSTLVWVLALCDLCHGFSTTGVSTRRIALRHATIATRPSSPHQLLLRTPMMMMMAEEGDATVADDVGGDLARGDHGLQIRRSSGSAFSRLWKAFRIPKWSPKSP